MENVFREALENGEFVVTCEMIPGRGAFEAYQEADHMKMRAIWETGLVHAISITDCPSGNPAISPPTVARRFAREGIPSIVHYTCKDRSRNMMQGELYAMQLRDLENLLIMSGDYQGSGFEGAGRPDFDLDPANALRLVSAMNEGLVYHGRDGDVRETPAHFFPGAVVNPYKYREGESIPQYLKLEKKLICGARFIIQQLGFDARKMQEQLFYVAERGYDVPMIANVFMLTKTAASLMRRGDIAGCIVTDKLMAELEEESDANALRPGYARGKRIERAAKQIAIARGLGYAGVHIGGVGLDADTVTEVLERSADYDANWRVCARELSYAPAGGFYLYEPELDENGALKFDIDGNEIELGVDALLIDSVQKEGSFAVSDYGITVAIDTNLTPELIEEGFVREIISKIQTMRKEADFDVMDKIVLYTGDNAKLNGIIEKNAESIKHDVLADEIVYAPGGDSAKEWNINGEKMTLGVSKK